MARTWSELRDGMRIDWDVPIQLPDGLVLRADIFRPDDDDVHPVLLTHGPYAKGLSFQEGFPGMWRRLETHYPETVAGSSNLYQVWETPDPEKWVPDGFACVRVDSRGAGRSAGFLDVFSRQETQDFRDCIEWAGVQPWSNGKVGLPGISYYAMNQWQVAALKPPHLAAIAPWEGGSDYYRELVRAGGILGLFFEKWYPQTVSRVQHGLGTRGLRSAVHGDLISGPETLTPAQLEANRPDHVREFRKRRLIDSYYLERSPILEDIEVPVLSGANWAHHLHTRGNFEGFVRAGSQEKWLEVHGWEHFVSFYTDEGIDIQKRFFSHYLRSEPTGTGADWNEQPRVTLNLREVAGTFRRRTADSWPLPETQFRTLYLRGDNTLSLTAPEQDERLTFAALGEGISFTTEPAVDETIVVGPISLHLAVASSTTDADIFATLRVLDPDGVDVTFRSALDPNGVITVGWLRASLRRTDPRRSRPGSPFHTFDEEQPLVPDGPAVGLEVELLPTSVVVPPGYRIAITITGKDFEWEGSGPWPELYGIPYRGQGIFLKDPLDRPEEVYGGRSTIVCGPNAPSYLSLPTID